MIFSELKKEIRVMFTPFRDGLQSVFGGKTRLNDILPAIEASAAAGIRHFEFGGGARFQAPFFYVGEDPFQCMSTIRKTVGPDADLQILTRSVSGVTLTTQRTSALALQAKLSPVRTKVNEFLQGVVRVIACVDWPNCCDSD